MSNFPFPKTATDAAPVDVALGIQRLLDRLARISNSETETDGPGIPPATSAAMDGTALPPGLVMPSASDQGGCLGIDEVAALLGVSARTVRRRVKDGSLRKAPLGGRLVRIPASEITRLLSGDKAR